MTDADNLARLRLATVTGRLPQDVGRWAVEHCARSVSATERRAARDRLLRAAAAAHGGTDWACATYILEQLEHFRLNPSAAESCTTACATPMALVAQAFAVDPKFPRHHRQVLRIVQASATSDISGA